METGGYTKEVNLTSDCLNDFSKIKKLDDPFVIENGLIIELKKRFAFAQIHEILRRLTPEAVTLAKESTLLMRILRLEESVKKIRKSKKKLEAIKDFLEKPFDFLEAGPKNSAPDTPRKKKLRREISSLKDEKQKALGVVKRIRIENEVLEKASAEREAYLELEKREILESSNVEMGKQKEYTNLLEEQIVEAATKNSELEREVAAIGETASTYKTRLGGVKSALIKEKKKRQQLSMQSETVRTCDKNIGTEIKDINKDIISISNSTENNEIMTGLRYYGAESKHKQLTSGKPGFFASISSSVPNSVVSSKTLSERAKQAFKILGAISGESSGGNKESLLLVTEMMRENPDFFKSAIEAAGLRSQEKISVKDAINIKALARLSMNKICDLRSCLANIGCNFWPSEGKMRHEEKLLTAHVAESSVESGTMALKKTATCENTSPQPFVRVTDLHDFIKVVFDGLPGELDQSLFNDEIWILLSGDKGGGSMKFHLEIINSVTSGSVDNVHIFCMYEGADTPENMWRVSHVFIRPITELQEGKFTIDGRKIRVFLGGDFHFIDDMLGHQGSAATYPSSTDLVTLEHLRNHADKSSQSRFLQY